MTTDLSRIGCASLLTLAAACGGSATNPIAASGSPATSGAQATSGVAAGSGASTTGSGAESGTTGAGGSTDAAGAPSGSSGEEAGASGAEASVASGALSDATSDAPAPAASPGCGKPWTHATGKFVEVAGPNTLPGLTVYGHLDYHPSALGPTVPITVPVADNGFSATEQRGYWVLIPAGYDPNKPYTVIYQGAGCDDVDAYNAGQDGFPFQSYDDGQAIQVGLDYDTESLVPECYNNQDPDSNDFAFVPWLMSEIENDFCVDEDRQFFEGYSSGAWLSQQLNCAYPSKFRGFVSVTGSEPPNQPTCNPAPAAWMHVHDLNDVANSYASILPGCSRILKQNGCTVTDCSDPTSTKVTTPYTFPPADTNPWVKNIPGGTTCTQFNGCPAKYPVVFCTTTGASRVEATWTPPAFWDFMSRLPN